MKREELSDVLTIDSYTDVIAEEADAAFHLDVEGDSQAAIGTPYTINCFHLLRAVESYRPKPKEISSFCASIHSDKLFVGTSTGVFIVLDKGGIYKDCFHTGRNRRINYLAEVREDCLLVLDDSMRLEFWEICTPVRMICTRKLPKVVAKHIRHVYYPESESIVLIFVTDQGIVLVSSCVADRSTVLTSRCFFIRQKDWRVTNVSACTAVPQATATHQYATVTNQIHEHLEILLSVLTDRWIVLIHVRMNRESCECHNFSRVELLNALPSESIHFSWAKPIKYSNKGNSFSSKVFLCTSYGKTLRVYNVETPKVAMLFEKKLDFSVDLLHWVDPFTLVAMDLTNSKILVLDAITQSISFFVSPTPIGKIRSQCMNRWDYVVQSHACDIFIGSLPMVHHVRLQRSCREILNITARNQSISSDLLESHILRTLRFEEAQYQLSQPSCASSEVSSRDIHFFQPVQQIVDFYLTSRPNGHLIVHLFNIFKDFRIEDIFIFTLEFFVCDGKLDSLPHSLTNLLCERFSTRFDEFLPLEKVCMLVSPSRSDELMGVFRAGSLYRLELCLANLTADFGYTLRKALELDLYIVLCTHHNHQFGDFQGPLRKLRTIGTNEALHTLMEYMLLLSSGKTFGSSSALEASMQNDLKGEMASHLSDIEFGMQLLQIDPAKFFSLFDALLLPYMERKKLTKYLLRIEQAFDGSIPGYSSSVIGQIFWNMHRMKYMQDGLLFVENIEQNVAFTAFHVLKLYEQITVDADELHELFSKRAMYSPSYPRTVYENEVSIVRRMLTKTLHNLMDVQSSVQYMPRLSQASFLFYHLKNSESFETIKKYHEWELLHHFTHHTPTEENASLLLSLPQCIQAEFNYLFTGLHFMRSGGLNTLQWTLSSKVRDGGALLFHFIATMARSTDSSNNTVTLGIILMHCIRHLLNVDVDKTASLIWKLYPECHTNLMKLLHDDRQGLNDYLQGTLSLLGLSKDTFVQKWGLSRVCNMHNQLDPPRRPHIKLLKVFYASLDHTAMNTLLGSHPINAYRFIRALLDARLITEHDGASRLEKIKYVGAQALGLALNQKSHEALIILQEHMEVVWKDCSSFPHDPVSDNCVVDVFFLQLRKLVEALDAMFAVFRTINEASLSEALNDFCTFASHLEIQSQGHTFTTNMYKLHELHRLNLLTNWMDGISTELRFQKFQKESTQHYQQKNFARRCFKVVTSKFTSLLIRDMLDRISPSDVWRNISVDNQSLILPLLVQQCKSTIKMLNDQTCDLKSRQKLMLGRIERKFLEAKDSRQVYIHDPPDDSHGYSHFNAPVLACFPCSHLVDSCQSYEQCPICATPTSWAVEHTFNQKILLSTAEMRQKNFRDATDSFLFGNLRMDSFIKNVQNEPEADLPSHLPVKIQPMKSLSPSIEIGEAHLRTEQEDPPRQAHIPEIRICLTAYQEAEIFGTH